MKNNISHIPVLLESALRELNVVPGNRYIDATLGAGGHSEEILKHGGKLLAIEADEQMKMRAEERLKTYCPTLVRGNFKDIEKIARENNFYPVSGILYDLGVSSFHYEDIPRGFSFKHKGEPLDMRLAPVDTAVTAATLLNILSEEQLTSLFHEVLPASARRIARSVVRARETKQFAIVDDMVSLGFRELPEIFLALRIAVNSEYDSIDEGIKGGFRVLEKGGRLVIISFHSLEDRAVVKALRELELAGEGKQVTKGPMHPSVTEVQENPKSRSALMRVFEKL